MSKKKYVFPDGMTYERFKEAQSMIATMTGEYMPQFEGNRVEEEDGAAEELVN